MAQQLISEEKQRTSLSMHPKKFALWLFIMSVVMIFAALTSAYIVRQSEGDWFVFELPNMFYFSSLVIIASSASLHWGVLAAQKDELGKLKAAISITTLLGIAFLVMQYIGWGQLVDMNVYFVGNPSGSFVYVLSGLHGVHLISGVVYLLIILVATFQFKVHAKSLTRLEMCATYWHFLGGLWLYLFVFMIVNR